ncbi:hypothetical protein MTO96_052076 [Rhipicephalus appendiculatus]
MADDDLLATLNVTMIACLLLLRRRRSRHAPRRFWVHPLWRYRDTEGHAHTLLPRLRARDEVFSEKLQKHRSNPAQRAEYLQRATFNYRLSRARRLIENAFGIMSSRWRILRRAFRASETTTENIVRACVVLNNFLLQEFPHSRLTYNPPGYVDHEDWEGRCMEGGWRDHDDDPSILREPSASGCHSAR